MMCPNCENKRIVTIGAGNVAVPCPKCQGMEPSCCDGPIGEPDENPNDPMESKNDFGHRN
jgi:hypothetical protein